MFTNNLKRIAAASIMSVSALGLAAGVAHADDNANAPSLDRQNDAPSVSQQSDAPSAPQRTDGPGVTAHIDAPSAPQRTDNANRLQHSGASSFFGQNKDKSSTDPQSDKPNMKFFDQPKFVLFELG